MKPIIVPIEDIILNRQNVEQHPIGQLRRLIRRGHELEPVMLRQDGEAYRIVQGKYRVLAQEAEGYKEVKAVVV